MPTDSKNGNGSKITPATLVNIGLVVAVVGATWQLSRQMSSDAEEQRTQMANTYVTKEVFNARFEAFEKLIGLRFDNLEKQLQRGDGQGKTEPPH